jgi:hypothetical protein
MRVVAQFGARAVRHDPAALEHVPALRQRL